MLAGLDAGLPWSVEMAAVVVSSLPVDEQIGETAWMVQPLNEVVERLNLRGEVDEAVDLVAHALKMHSQADTEAHKEAFTAAEALGDASSAARVPRLPVTWPTWRVRPWKASRTDARLDEAASGAKSSTVS
ncbi:hypothetical protein ACWFRM_38165 [Streptomyces sp. NPDC055144]